MTAKITRFMHKTVTRSYHVIQEPSTSAYCPIDYEFSNRVLSESKQKIERYGNLFVYSLNEEMIMVEKKRQMISQARSILNYALGKNGAFLVPIGSAANHLLTPDSDLDLVLLPSKNEKEWRKFMETFEKNAGFRREILKNAARNIGKRKDLQISSMKTLADIKVPLLKMEFGHRNWGKNEKLKVDIQIGNIDAIRSTLFIRTCVEHDERVRHVCRWLTRKFGDGGILGSINGLFSKYHVNTMVLHFLQAMPYPVLPDVIALCPWLSTKNDWNNAVKVLGRQSSLYVPCSTERPNESTIGELIIQMIDYFSQIDFSKNAIDNRGRVLKKKDPEFSVEIQDEYFDIPSTCRVLDGAELLSKFFKDQKMMLNNGDFKGFFT